MALLGSVIVEEVQNHRVLLRALEGSGPVGSIQASGPVLLFLLEAVGLSGAAYAAAGAGHDLHQVVIGGARLDLLEQLLGVIRPWTTASLISRSPI